MYELVTSAKDTDDLSLGFDQIYNRRQQKSTNNQNIEGKYHLRIMIKHLFSFAKHQEKAMKDLGYTLTLTRKEDDAVLSKTEAIADARILTYNIH